MIHTKPFIFGEMLRRTIFLSRPNFFNAEDLNKELLTIHSFLEEFNKKFAVLSDVEFTFNTFGESVDTSGTEPMIVRNFHINWSTSSVIYKGVKFSIEAGGVNHTHTYQQPETDISPRKVAPPTYVVLLGDLRTVNFAENNILCGLTADETPQIVPTVNVEQYQNVQVAVSDDLSETNILCVLGTIYPRYKDDGSEDGYGFLKNTFKNELLTINNGVDREKTNLDTNKTLFEYITEKFTFRYNQIINERQLARKFNLADLSDVVKARKNLGFDKVINHEQLVKAENLKDLPSPAHARKHLGLGSSATKKVGNSASDVARGDVLVVGMVIMWFGAINQIPRGWQQCDGTGGTPDMRGRFPVGYNAGDNDHLMGSDGGAKMVTLTAQQSGLKGHGHGVIDPGHSHSTPSRGTEKVSSSGNNNSISKNHSGDVPITISTSATGISITAVSDQNASEPHENRPPYRTLMFLMYIGNENYPDDSTVLPAQADLPYPNFSTPTTGTNGSDGGYSNYDYGSSGNSGQINLGAGVLLTNPE